MEIKISVRIGGEHKGSKIVQTPCYIGRSKEAGLTISHPSVSRKHCELFEDGGQLYLRDNSSLNGTLLKGEFVEEPVAVHPGDEFVIGELLLRIEPSSEAETVDHETVAKVPDTDCPTAGMVTMIEPANKVEIDDDGELRLASE